MTAALKSLDRRLRRRLPFWPHPVAESAPWALLLALLLALPAALAAGLWAFWLHPGAAALATLSAALAGLRDALKRKFLT